MSEQAVEAKTEEVAVSIAVVEELDFQHHAGASIFSTPVGLVQGLTKLAVHFASLSRGKRPQSFTVSANFATVFAGVLRGLNSRGYWIREMALLREAIAEYRRSPHGRRENSLLQATCRLVTRDGQPFSRLNLVSAFESFAQDVIQTPLVVPVGRYDGPDRRGNSRIDTNFGTTPELVQAQ